MIDTTNLDEFKNDFGIVCLIGERLILLIRYILNTQLFSKFILRKLDFMSLRIHLGKDFLSPIEHFVLDGYTEKLFMNLKLNREDTAIVLGGYKGDSASKLLRYDCKVIIFEPVPEYARILTSRFKDEKVDVIERAVSNRDGNYVIFLNGEATSSLVQSKKRIVVKCLNFSKYITKIGRISFLEVNIEGGEYDLILNLIKTGKIKNIQILIIQFHKYSLESELERQKIRNLLQATHSEVYCYDWVWERWDIKS